MSVKMLMT